MAEKATSKSFRTLQIFISLVGIAVAITAALLTIAARKKELTCTQVNSSRLVSENLGGIHPDLHVDFRGQTIFSLTKMTFTLRNTGAAAIKAGDVIESVRLQFPPTTKLMSATLERTFPPDSKFSIAALPESKQVVFDFPLLNAGDEIIFSVYVFNSEAQHPSLQGRIVDVPQLIYNEVNVVPGLEGKWLFRSHAMRSVIHWALIVFHSFWALFFFAIWSISSVEYVTYTAWKHKWGEKYDGLISALSKRPAGSRVDAERDREIDKIPREPRPLFLTFNEFAILTVFLLGLASAYATTLLIVQDAMKN